MNILVCSWANIFEPDIIYTFEEMGFHVDKITADLSDPFSDSTYLKLLSTKLLSSPYDFVFSANYIPIVSMACNVHKIRYISWIADSPCFELNSYTIANPCNYIFIFDKLLYQYYKRESPYNIYYMPLGSNIERLDNIILSHKEQLMYQSDISFIGSLYTYRSKYSNVLLSDYWRGYFEGIIESQLLIYGYNLISDTISDEAFDAFSSAARWDKSSILNESDKLCKINAKKIIADNYIGRECSHRERIRVIQTLSKHFNFDLYTYDDTSEIPHANHKGIVEPFIDSFKIYKASKINLNITSKTIKSGLPLRIFDILGAGGFLITNYQSELPDYFDINKDLVIYENMNDLIDKVSYYLKHEEERLVIAKNGYNKVKKLYDYKTQIIKILKVVLGNN